MLSELMAQLYESGELDEQVVSVNSAFVCLLHLGNEQQLHFGQLWEDNEQEVGEDEDVERDIVITK